MGQWQNFYETPIENLFNDVGCDDSPEGVKDCLGPWRHFLALTAWQITKLLTPDGIERAEDHYLLMEPSFHDCLKSCGKCERRFAGSCPTSE
jgi:hypothetical protein